MQKSKSQVIIVKPFSCGSYVPKKNCNVVEDVIRLQRDINGTCFYYKHGEKNVREYVQSFKKSASLQDMLSRISLMPTSEKINMLNQTENGVYADMTSMPTDATAAFILYTKYKEKYPQIAEQVKAGKTFDSIINEIFKPISKGDNVNGSNESGNDGSAEV